MIYSERIR